LIPNLTPFEAVFSVAYIHAKSVTTSASWMKRLAAILGVALHTCTAASRIASVANAARESKTHSINQRHVGDV
jgi:hypothetical protein